METITSVIFDWGGGLIEDPAPCLMQYCAKALQVNTEDYIKAHSKFGADFQKGLIGEDAFWEKICGELNVPIPKNPSLWAEAFEAAYVPRNDMFAMAASLQKNGYKTAILSNTEVPAVQLFFLQRYEMFDAAVFSCLEGLEKPDKEIYEITLKKLGCQPEQAILIDDKQQYINGAKKVGLKTLLFQNIRQVKEELARLGVKIV